MISEREKQKYFKMVSRHIPCSKKDKEECLSVFKCSAEDIISQEDEITLEKLKTILGEPKKAAKQLEDAIEPEKIKRYKRKRLLLSVIVILLILVLFVAIYLFLVHKAVQPIYVFTEPIV